MQLNLKQPGKGEVPGSNRPADMIPAARKADFRTGSIIAVNAAQVIRINAGCRNSRQSILLRQHYSLKNLQNSR